MALKPNPPQRPGPTGVGSNQPTHGAGQEPDDAEEEESQRKFREEQEKDLKQGESRGLVRSEVEERAGEVPVAAFLITNNGTGDLDIYQLAVAPDGIVVQRYMRSLKPREVLTIESALNAIRIRAAVPGAVPAQAIHGFA